MEMGYVAGEHVNRDVPAVLRNGLSPLARGTRQRLVFPDGKARFIPAGAGNTPEHAIILLAAMAYPRSRGEHAVITIQRIHTFGLSPLARGTRSFSRPFFSRSRFIPARAGNTAAPATECDTSAVYPRSRGEHYGSNKKMIALSGLSPLARGTQKVTQNNSVIDRFIPAGARNTLNVTH